MGNRAVGPRSKTMQAGGAPRASPQLLFKLSITLEGGRDEVLAVFAGDDPFAVASRFAAVHGLPDVAVPQLYDSIVANLQSIQMQSPQAHDIPSRSAPRESDSRLESRSAFTPGGRRPSVSPARARPGPQVIPPPPIYKDRKPWEGSLREGSGSIASPRSPARSANRRPSTTPRSGQDWHAPPAAEYHQARGYSPRNILKWISLLKAIHYECHQLCNSLGGLLWWHARFHSKHHSPEQQPHHSARVRQVERCNNHSMLVFLRMGVLSLQRIDGP